MTKNGKPFTFLFKRSSNSRIFIRRFEVSRRVIQNGSLCIAFVLFSTLLGGGIYGVVFGKFGGDLKNTVALASEPAQRRFMADGGILGCNPLFDPLRNDPRFQQAMRRWSVKPCLRAGPG